LIEQPVIYFAEFTRSLAGKAYHCHGKVGWHRHGGQPEHPAEVF
jgi:hypothetical protein